MAEYNNFQTNKPHRIGYALSGGFIKGFAHLGVMQALLEHDIKPDIISGVSAGSLAGVFYADGYEPYQAVEKFNGYKFMDLTSWALTINGFFKLDDFKDFLNTNLKHKRLEDMEIPLVITATDLDHGKSVQFRKGNIAELVAASCCMPVMFAPVNIDGINYVDGGVLKNLPVSTIRKECEKVIAINVSPLIAGKYKMNIVNIALRSYHFMFRANTFPDRENSDLLIEPYGLKGYSNRELEKAEEIFKQGYAVGNEVLNKFIQEKGTIWKTKEIK
ncbi:NTE family protein [Bacteroides luti]|uniref:NTE family protein n=1 Tax=Bacteroides luti TaxID=1297750 RepID=A0A1M5E5G0_9BACE|nr:patatin-like phospholipase family protein [Bacteroides luti]SHF74400.1 NTE family protein [Bacteroides luti]